jgi:hypothetical protein
MDRSYAFLRSPAEIAKSAILFLVLAVFSAGCTYTVAVTDNVAAYSMPLIQGTPKVILSDLSDNRSDRKTLGQIGGLTVADSSTPMNVILTNRIATRLRDEGFNVQKANLTKPGDPAELAHLMASSNGTVFLSGGLNSFYVSSFDAVMETGKGSVHFYIDVFDERGSAIFNGKYSAYAEHWIGLTGQFGTDKLVEMSVKSSVDDLFNDRRFRELLNKIKK